MRLPLAALAFAALAMSACSPAEAPTPTEPSEAAALTPPPQADDPDIGQAIAQVLGENAAATRTAMRIIGEGEQRLALVYLVGPNWCGSGGCNLLILRHNAGGWAQVGNVSRVSMPVRQLNTSTYGLPDIGVMVSGGGGPPAYETRLSFDGRTYPRFPSDEPLVGAAGTVVLTDADVAAPTG